MDIAEKKEKTELELPTDITKKNCVIEISGMGIQNFKTHFPSSIKVEITEEFGELKVTTNEGHPLPKAYVKVFSKNSGGAINFYKDGYTDIRGRFDYASLNTSQFSNIDKFGILVNSESHGSLTQECKPPKGMVREEELGVKKQSLERYNIRSCKQKGKKGGY
jgi:hypothetical protein